MRVLHIIDSLGLGGAQTIIKGIFENQKKNKDIFLFVLRKREVNISISHPNILIYDSEEKYSFKPLKQLKNIIKEKKIDILHCHLFRSQVFGWILKKYYFPHIKLIFHEHGEIFQEHLYYDLFMRIAQKETNKIIAVSEATRNELIIKANILSLKIKVIHNFIDINKFSKEKVNKNKIKDQYGLGKEDYVIGFVGRLSKVKGCDVLIKSLPALTFKYKVIIAGDGPEKANLEKMAKIKGVENKIVFLGYIENIKDIYSLLNVLVIPSQKESFGLAAIEAQFLGIPIIASNIPGLNNVLNKESSLLFERNNTDDLIEKLFLIKNDLTVKRRLIKYGNLNCKRYSLNDFIKNVNEVYR